MKLPEGFVFSQGNLQDYVECARRFELAYLEGLKWPAVQAEPALEREAHMRQGALFHKLVQQHASGVSVGALARRVTEEPLRTWWANYERVMADLPARRYVEVTLSAPLEALGGVYRLVAKYDLVAVVPGERAVIVDWKTAGHVPSHSHLKTRLQTVVYRYLLVAAAAHLNGGVRFDPSQVEMVYVFVGAGGEALRFPYDYAQYKKDEAYLTGLVSDIYTRAIFDKTDDERKCVYCIYRSLCGRGVQAGNIQISDDSAADGPDFDLDFDQIAEVEF